VWITERGKDRIIVDPEICEEPSRGEKIRLREQLSMIKEIFCEFLTERLLLKNNDVYKVSAKIFELGECGIARWLLEVCALEISPCKAEFFSKVFSQLLKGQNMRFFRQNERGPSSSKITLCFILIQ